MATPFSSRLFCFLFAGPQSSCCFGHCVLWVCVMALHPFASARSRLLHGLHYIFGWIIVKGKVAPRGTRDPDAPSASRRTSLMCHKVLSEAAHAGSGTVVFQWCLFISLCPGCGVWVWLQCWNQEREVEECSESMGRIVHVQFSPHVVLNVGLIHQENQDVPEYIILALRQKLLITPSHDKYISRT